MGLKLLGWALAGALAVLVVRWFVRQRGLRSGRLQRCAHCGRPYGGSPVYCPHCGEVLQHGSQRR